MSDDEWLKEVGKFDLTKRETLRNLVGHFTQFKGENVNAIKQKLCSYFNAVLRAQRQYLTFGGDQLMFIFVTLMNEEEE